MWLNRKLLTGVILLLMIGPLFLKAQEIYLAQWKQGPCTFRLTASLKWQSLAVRSQRADLKSCTVGQKVLLRLLQQAIANKASFLKAHSFSSLFIGRIVEYPALMSYLITQSRNDSLWLPEKGRPEKGDVNQYVAKLMERHPLIGKINRLLDKVGYRVAGISVEKVLVRSYRNIPHYHGQPFNGVLPFDAQLYFVLAKVKKLP